MPRAAELEQRVRVLEQIVTDGGAQTAAQIEALRGSPSRRSSRLASGKEPGGLIGRRRIPKWGGATGGIEYVR